MTTVKKRIKEAFAEEIIPIDNELSSIQTKSANDNDRQWAEALESIREKYDINTLEESGAEVDMHMGLIVKCEANSSFHSKSNILYVSYEYWRRNKDEDANVFNERFVDFKFSAPGYNWRYGSTDTPESMNKDFDDYLKLSQQVNVVIEWLKTHDVIELMKELWDISKRIDNSATQKDFDTQRDEQYELRRIKTNELVDRIFNSLSTGDDLDGIVERITVNGRYRGEYDTSEVTFDRVIKERIRVLHTFPENSNIKSRKQYIDIEKVKSSIKWALFHCED